MSSVHRQDVVVYSCKADPQQPDVTERSYEEDPQPHKELLSSMFSADLTRDVKLISQCGPLTAHFDLSGLDQ